MTTQDSLNQLDELLKEEQKYSNDGTYGAFTEDMICKCKHIINKMDAPPEVFFTADNGVELVYRTENVYLAVEIFLYDYGVFLQVEDVNCGWITLRSEQSVIKWWNSLIKIISKDKRVFIKIKK